VLLQSNRVRPIELLTNRKRTTSADDEGEVTSSRSLHCCYSCTVAKQAHKKHVMNLLYGGSINKGKSNSQKANSMPKLQSIVQWCSKPLYTKDLTIRRNISNFWCPGSNRKLFRRFASSGRGSSTHNNHERMGLEPIMETCTDSRRFGRV